MKEAQDFSARLIRQFLVCAALLMAAGCATESQPGGVEPLPAKVVRLKGRARWSSDDHKSWQEIKVGSKAPSGVLVQTAAKSRIDVSLGQSAAPMPRAGLDKGMLYNPNLYPCNFMRVWENSELNFDRLARWRPRGWEDFVEDVRFNLRTGHMLLLVSGMSADSRYEIKFPNGVIRIRDGTYDIRAEGCVKVVAGRASVTVADSPKTQEVLGGQLFDARTGAITAIPD